MLDGLYICSVINPARGFTVLLNRLKTNLSDMIHTDHGRSPSQGRPGALVEVICRHHASVGHLEPGVHVNTPRASPFSHEPR